MEAFINSYKLLIKSSVIFPYGTVEQKYLDRFSLCSLILKVLYDYLQYQDPKLRDLETCFQLHINPDSPD